MARAPCWSACRRPADGRRRLPGAAQLLGRLRTGGRARGAYRRPPREWRGVALPGRRVVGGRPTGAARPDRWLLRLDGVARRAADAHRRRIWSGAVSSDVAPPPRCPKHGPGAPAVLGPSAPAADLPIRAHADIRLGRRGCLGHAPPRAAGGMAWIPRPG